MRSRTRALSNKPMQSDGPSRPGTFLSIHPAPTRLAFPAFEWRRDMQRPARLVLLVAALSFLFIPMTATGEDAAALKSSLQYLSKIDEVRWLEFDRNNVYIGFDRRPADLAAVVNAAAVIGNRAYGFGVHVWAVNAENSGWRPGDGPYYCEATARHGELKNSCR